MRLIADSLEEAVELLAKRAADLRSRPRTWSEKKAAGLSDVLGGMGSWAKANPLAASGVAGGALGAGIGGIGTMLGNRGKDEDEQRSTLGSTLTGGLAGAAMGAGGAAVYQGSKGMQAPKETPLTALNQKVKELQAKNPIDEAVKGTASGVWSGIKSHPWTTGTLAGLGSLDAALHSQNARLGERIGWGMIRPEMSTDKNHLLKGIQEHGDALGISESVQKALLRNSPNVPGTIAADSHPAARVPGNKSTTGVTDLVGRHSMAGTPGESFLTRAWNRLRGVEGPGDAALLRVYDQPNLEHTEREAINASNPQAGYKETKTTTPGSTKTDTLTRQQQQQAKLRGYESSLAKDEAPGIFKGIFRQRKLAPRALRIGGRLTGYGGILGASYLNDLWNRDTDKEKQLAELMASHPELGKHK